MHSYQNTSKHCAIKLWYSSKSNLMKIRIICKIMTPSAKSSRDVRLTLKLALLIPTKSNYIHTYPQTQISSQSIISMKTLLFITSHFAIKKLKSRPSLYSPSNFLCAVASAGKPKKCFCFTIHVSLLQTHNIPECFPPCIAHAAHYYLTLLLELYRARRK